MLSLSHGLSLTKTVVAPLLATGSRSSTQRVTNGFDATNSLLRTLHLGNGQIHRNNLKKNIQNVSNGFHCTNTFFTQKHYNKTFVSQSLGDFNYNPLCASRVKGLPTKKKYSFRVLAENLAGPGKPSAETDPVLIKDPIGLSQHIPSLPTTFLSRYILMTK